MEAAIWLVFGSTAMSLPGSPIIHTKPSPAAVSPSPPLATYVDFWPTGELDLAALCPAS